MRRAQKRPGSRSKTRKNRLGKRLLVIAGVFFLLVVLAGVFVSVFIDEEFLTAEIEKSINSKVEIGELDISLFSHPAEIRLRDVSLSPRDGSDTPAGQVPIRIEEVRLSVSLWGLLRRHLDVSHILIRGAKITSIYREDGTTSLGGMFAAPEKNRRKKSRKGKGSGLNVFEQEDLIATLGGLSIENSQVDITLESSGIRLRGTDMHIELSAIKIDPNKLNETNTATLTLEGMVRIDSVRGWPYGELYLTGNASARIFNPETGDAEPDITGDISLGDASWLNTEVPFITKAWKHLSVLEPLGIKVPEMPERATFGRSEAISAHYHLGRITVLKPLSIWVGDWEIAAMENSWVQTQTDKHEIKGELLASKNASVVLRSLIEKAGGFLPKELRQRVLEDVEKQMFRDGRMWVKIKSSGDFSDPSIRPDGAIVDFSKAGKKAAKKLLREKAGGLLRGLLEKKKDNKKDDKKDD